MIDRIMALIAFVFFTGFLGIIVFSVQHVALILVCLFGIGLVTYDFWSQLARRR